MLFDDEIDLNSLAKASMLKPKNKLIQKAYDEAAVSFYKKMFQATMYANFAEYGTVPEETTNPKFMQLIEDSLNRTMSKPPYMFITINPTSDVSLSRLRKKVEKFANRRIIANYFYTYEVREENKGLHVHMIVRYQNVRPYDFKLACKNTFKSVCDANNPHCLNLKQISEDVVQDKVNYLLGHKQDSKTPGVEASKKYRKDNDLEQFYDSSPPFPCRATQLSIDVVDDDIPPLEPPKLIRK